MTGPISETSLTGHERLRRILRLCSGALQNFAYYKAGWNGGKPLFSEQPLVVANGNYLDIGVLEWCKLFGANSERHHWSRLVTDADKRRHFESDLFAALDCDHAQWSTFRDGMLAYRDKFLAHLDDKRVMHIPTLDLAIKSAMFLHAYVMVNESESGRYAGLPEDAAVWFARCFTEAATYYGKR